MVCKHQDKSLHLSWDKRHLHFLAIYHQNLSFKSLCLACYLKYLCGKLFPRKHSIFAPSQCHSVIFIFCQFLSFLQIMNCLMTKRCSCQVFILQWLNNFSPKASISFTSFHIKWSLNLPSDQDFLMFGLVFLSCFLSNSTLIQPQIMGCRLCKMH